MHLVFVFILSIGTKGIKTFYIYTSVNAQYNSSNFEHQD